MNSTQQVTWSTVGGEQVCQKKGNAMQFSLRRLFGFVTLGCVALPGRKGSVSGKGVSTAPPALLAGSSRIGPTGPCSFGLVGKCLGSTHYPRRKTQLVDSLRPSRRGRVIGFSEYSEASPIQEPRERAIRRGGRFTACSGRKSLARGGVHDPGHERSLPICTGHIALCR